MKQLLKIAIAFNFIILISISSKAQCITNAGGTVALGTVLSLPGDLSISIGNDFYYTVSVSGSNFIQNLGFGVDNVMWVATSTTNPVPVIRTLTAGYHSWRTTGTIPANAGCGLTETITINIYVNGGGWICSSTFAISTPPIAPALSISGSGQVCLTNPTTLFVNGASSPGCTYTWTSSNIAWRGNSQSFPVITTANSISVNSVAPGVPTTIQVSINNLTGYCGTPAPASKVMASIDFVLSLSAPLQCGKLSTNPHDALQVTATNIPGATYVWYKKDPGTTTWIPIGGANINTKFYNSIIPGMTGVKVVVTNSQGCTKVATMELLFCSPFNSCCNALRISSDKEENILSDINALYPNPTTGILNIDLFGADGTIEIYSYDGKLLRSEILNGENSSIDISELNSGIYLSVIKNNNGELLKSERIILNK